VYCIVLYQVYCIVLYWISKANDENSLVKKIFVVCPISKASDKISQAVSDLPTATCTHRIWIVFLCLNLSLGYEVTPTYQLTDLLAQLDKFFRLSVTQFLSVRFTEYRYRHCIEEFFQFYWAQNFVLTWWEIFILKFIIHAFNTFKPCMPRGYLRFQRFASHSACFKRKKASVLQSID